MGLFGKSAQQKRIDALAYRVCVLEQTLDAEQKRSREKGRLASELLSERDAARIERDTAQRERDSYREDALKHRRSRSHLKQFRGSGAVAGSPGTTVLNG